MNDFDKELNCMPEMTGIIEVGNSDRRAVTAHHLLTVLGCVEPELPTEFPELYLKAIKRLIEYGLKYKTPYAIVNARIIWEDDLRKIVAL